MSRDNTNSRSFIIAEAGVNHNGSLELAHKLVDAAAEAGADAVKFQTFTAEGLVSRRAPKAEYQKRTTGSDESQFEMIKRLELPREAHFELKQYCESKGIEFMSSPFDIDAIRFLGEELRVRRLKIPSGEITNGPFLLAAARSGLPIILSSGVSTLDDVEGALKVIAFGLVNASGHPSNEELGNAFQSSRGRRLLADRVTLLHCTTEYPAPFDEVNLSAMRTMADSFGLPVGYSDHTKGISVSIAAAALGAVVLEKHFTLDRSLEGPDHKASLEPVELADLVRSVREVERAIGDGIKRPRETEMKNQAIARKSLVALRPIEKGEVFSAENLGAKRPGDGISPMEYWSFLGKRAIRAYEEGESILREG